MFRVGQKVVCVDDGPYPRDIGRVDTLPMPTGIISVGEVYTIRGILKHPILGVFCVYLDGIVREVCPRSKIEASISATRFRPVQEKGMEMLRAILVHPKSPVKEDA